MSPTIVFIFYFENHFSWTRGTRSHCRREVFSALLYSAVQPNRRESVPVGGFCARIVWAWAGSCRHERAAGHTARPGLQHTLRASTAVCHSLLSQDEMHAAHTPSYSMEEPAMIVSRPGGPPRCGRSTCAAWRSRRPPPARGENQMTRAKSISTSLQAADTAGGRAAEASLLNTNNTLSFLAFAPARAPWRGG